MSALLSAALSIPSFAQAPAAAGKSSASPAWQGHAVPETPFDLKIIGSGFYSIEGARPKAGRRTVEQIFSQAETFQYTNDTVGDDWQNPAVTEKLKAGDCEDMAVWVYQQLKRNGYANVRIMVGRFEAAEKDFHTWAVCSNEGGDDLIVDPALQRRIWKRSDLLPEVYVPAYSFDGTTKFAH